MLSRIFQSRPNPDLCATRTALSYTSFELAILSLCAQAIAYYVRTGHWPKLAPHTTEYALVWP
jgi:hypothetical protein